MGNSWSRSTAAPEEAPQEAPVASASTHATDPPPPPPPAHATAPTLPPLPRPTPVTGMTEHGSAPAKRVAMDLSDRAIHLCAQDAILAVQNRALRCGPRPSRVTQPAHAHGAAGRVRRLGMVDGATTQHILNMAAAMDSSGAGSSDAAMAACTVLDSPTQLRLYKMLREPLTNLQVWGGWVGHGAGSWGLGMGAG